MNHTITKPSNLDTLPLEAQQHVKLAKTMLEKALQALGSDTCTEADIQTAIGRTHSASRNLNRAIASLNTAKGGAA